jgi:hypothetical protein
MAQIVMLRHSKTGIEKEGFVGFSWTVLFFGGFPLLFRGDSLRGLLFIVLHFFTFGISGIVLAFSYNKQYTEKLIEQGYDFADSPEKVALARSELDATKKTLAETNTLPALSPLTIIPAAKKPPLAEGMKVCPICAESVKVDAMICSFCQYKFRNKDFRKLKLSVAELNKWKRVRLQEIVTFLSTTSPYVGVTLAGDSVAEIQALLKDVKIVVTEGDTFRKRYELKTKESTKFAYSDRELSSAINQIQSKSRKSGTKRSMRLRLRERKKQGEKK